MQQYRIHKGSIHEKFLASRAKIQIFGGGFANGKTATTCVKCIQIARDYPGSNGLIARASYPKLLDTIHKEYFKWLPETWIKHYTKSENRPTLTLKNGSVINFRYVQQQGKQQAASTSNLLSATYDYIAVDQFDDPEFQHKDFTDLLGRLRGGARYSGDDSTMPISGPRWLLCTLNPTRNWFFREIIKPILDYKEAGRVPDKLAEQLAKFETERVEDFIELVQGSTRDNAHNLGDDYLRTLEATYSGTMASRYIEGDWGAFQGLVYSMYDERVHMIDEVDIKRWKFSSNITQWIECYDFGTRAPACYLLGFRDSQHNVVFVDGLYERGLSPEDTVNKIREVRVRWNVPTDTNKPIYADPAIFRTTGGEYKTVGKSIAEILRNGGLGVTLTRGNNEIKGGLVKVQSYLKPHKQHISPFTGRTPAPFLYFNRQKLHFVDAEITDYYYQDPDVEGSDEEKPQDRNDHAMDAIKYGLTDLPDLKAILPVTPQDLSYLTTWREAPDDWNTDGKAGPRYG